MKSRAIRWVWYTTILLVLATIMSSYDMAFKWVFSLVVIGQAALIFMVYSVLTDDYKTDLTFENGYQDRPLKVESDHYR